MGRNDFHPTFMVPRLRREVLTRPDHLKLIDALLQLSNIIGTPEQFSAASPRHPAANV